MSKSTTKLPLTITRRPRFLAEVPSQPADQEWVYQMARIWQLDPTQIGIVANIRRCHLYTCDLEEGNDLLIFDRIDGARPKAVVPLNRNTLGTDPRTGGRILLVRYPADGGFIPLGALLADGTPHPHAGTGFGTATVIGFPADEAGIPTVDGVGNVPDIYQALEVQQYRYDGRRFVVEHSQMLDGADFLPGWNLWTGPLGNALPDGDDLISTFCACRPGRKQDYHTCFARWQRRDGRWRLANLTSVTGPDGTIEPSLVRDGDGSLLVSGRGGGYQDFNLGTTDADVQSRQHDARVWRSTDNGVSWELILNERLVRCYTPVTLNKTTDGTVYLVGNPYRETDSRGQAVGSINMRESLLAWPLAADRRSLLPPVMVRDCNADFGVPPYGSIWRADHPVGMNVRLADCRWHHLLTYRVLEQDECVGDAAATPFTGTYIDEVITSGPATAPEWRFE